jgi:hypothetical protein
MAYGSLLSDVVQSSVVGTPPQFNDGGGTQVGTLCRAWVNFNGVTTATIRGSFNVSSVTRNTTGDFTINFTNAMADTNYSYIGVGRRNSATPLIIAFSIPNTTAYDPLTTSVRFQTRSDASGAEDPLNFSVNVFR